MNHLFETLIAYFDSEFESIWFLLELALVFLDVVDDLGLEALSILLWMFEVRASNHFLWE